MTRNDFSQPPPLRLAWFIWGLGAALYFAGFFHRVAPGVITDELMRDFGLGAAGLGGLSAFYFYTYVAMQVPTGILADRLGPRPLLGWGALIASVGAVMFALAPGFAMAAAGRALIGASVAVAFVCMLKLAAHWLDARRFALASGMALCVGMIGAVSAGVPLRLGVDAFGWRPVMIAIAGATLVIAVLIAWFVREDPNAYGYQSHAPTDAQPPKSEGILRGILNVFRYRNSWLLVVIPGGVVGPLLTFAGLWGVPFLTRHYGMSANEAAVYTSVLLLAWAAGGPAFGALADHLQRRKSVYLAGVITLLAGWLLVIHIPDLPRTLLLGLLIVIGLASGAMIVSFAFGKESVPPHLAGTSAGLINMGVMVGPMILQPLVGRMLERAWDGSKIDGTPVYALATYQWAFTAMLVWTAASVVLLAFTRETYGHQQRADAV